MTKKEKDTLTKEIKESQEWWKDSSGENVWEEEQPKRNNEYSNPVAEDLSAMVKEVGGRFALRLQPGIESLYPEGLPITPFISLLDPPRLATPELWEETRGQRGIIHKIIKFIKSLNNGL